MTISNIAQNQMGPAMMRVASGQRINSAADDAAGLAIMDEMTAQIRGLDQGATNARDMQGLVATAEGAMDTIGDSIQRVRALTVQAANGTNTPENRNIIQQEIDQLLNHIETTVRGTDYNTMTLFDGPDALNTAIGPSGNVATIHMPDMRTIATAITGVDVTNAANAAENINLLDEVMFEISTGRAELGAATIMLENVIVTNAVSSLNLADARSRIADTDMTAETTAIHQERVMNQMELLMQMNTQDQLEDTAQMTIAAGVV